MRKWETVRLGDVATYINGYAFKPSDWSDKGLPIIRIQNLTGNDYETNYYSGDYDERYEVNNGDVLISWSASLGVYEWKRDTALLNQHIFKVVFDKLGVDKSYFMHTVTHLLDDMTKETHGSTMKHITKPRFDNTPFPYPPLKIQRQIAANLDKITHLIDLCNNILDRLDELVKARFVEMFGDPVTNPKKWAIKEVIEECKCLVPGRDKPKSFTGDIPWITIEDLIVDGVTYVSKKGLGLTEAEIKQVNRKTIPVGSVVMSCVGNLGICSIAGKEMVINQQLHSFQCGANVNNVYLMFNLSYRKDYMNKWASNTTVLYMNKTICNSIPIMLPPRPLQEQFATFVQQTDKTKSAVKQVLEKAETLKKALMQEYFG